MLTPCAFTGGRETPCAGLYSCPEQPALLGSALPMAGGAMRSDSENLWFYKSLIPNKLR